MDNSMIIPVVGITLTIGLAATKGISWVFKAAVKTAIEPIDKRLSIIETRVQLVWGVTEQRAAETLHHSDQPYFDDLIEQFQAHTLTEQQLDQFIQRLEVISYDKANVTAQIPAAKVMLASARAERDARTGLVGNEPAHVSMAVQIKLKENLEAGEVMRAEAEPRRNKTTDDGDLPLIESKEEPK